MVNVENQQVRRLVRRTDGKVIAGVAGGLADYFGVDVVWLRLGFVLALILGGAGLLVYLILMVLMPRDASGEPTSMEQRMEHVARSLRGTPAWIGVGLLVLGSLLVLGQITEGKPGVFWGITLIVLGVILFRRHEPRAWTENTPSASFAPPAPGSIAADTPPPLPSDVPVRYAAPSSPRVARQRSGLGWITLGVTLVAEGIAAALDQGGAVHITLVQYLALALAILGIGIAIGTLWGRARWLVVPALALVPFVLVASLIKVPFEGGMGDQSFAPVAASAIASPYRIVAGRLEIDLSHTTLGGEPITVVATAVAGQIRVIVPAGLPLIIDARAGAGEVSLFGRTYDGVNLDVRRTFAGTVKVPALHLNLETSLGQVEVRS